MSLILQFHDSPRLRRKPGRAGTGRSYYGWALKRLIAAEPPQSKRDRDAQFRWLLLLLMAFCIFAAYLIVEYGR